VTAKADAAVSFEALGLSPAMLETLRRIEYLAPSPIQAGLIPRALAGVDLLGQARTGTGKTAAFGIPILERLEPHKSGQGPQALVLVPTRELAVQVREEIEKLAQGKKIHSIALYGGKPIKGQIDKLRRGADFIIGTPGRVLDHMSRGTLVLSDLRFVVLDEADRMLDIGFRPDIERILKRCPADRQTLLLSATVPPPVERLALRYMRDPESLNFSPTDISCETIEQFYFTVDPERKFDLLERLLKREQPRQAIIFCRTKRGTDKVHLRLSKRFSAVACIHGDLQQSSRDRVMAGFREGAVKVLVATDVVGRGIDVTNISHIINYDIPVFCDDYVHRVGRTGRMGREGVAYTFVTPEEGGELTRIEMRIDRLLRRDEISGFEAFSTRGGLPENGAAPGRAETALTTEARPEAGAPEPEPAAAPAGPRPMSARRGRRHRKAL
jgi:ATP-dependent RNA helicase DeaD